MAEKLSVYRTSRMKGALRYSLLRLGKLSLGLLALILLSDIIALIMGLTGFSTCEGTGVSANWALTLLLMLVLSCMLAKIQVLMLQNDILELQNNPNYSLDNSNSVYVIFMLIGIIGYFTVPTVAGWIVQAGGAGNYNRNINRTATKTGGFAAGAAGSGLGNIGGRLRGK